ncbi:glycosyltransferase [Mangrovihabitans endophyticus]|uniref:Glycosyl transferase n=1 Tax=Mangrovihabitans endophyticus TaxID=1751298 RepID=A0A8J3FMP6_9ACTN|nr:glycosyltransferase [Mangrovihabitans endophyticus]GGK80993.1 glycosyl transferase [Mangrovihabitans endophyticus]
MSAGASDRTERSAPGLRLVAPPARLADAPAPGWAHIARLSDDVGLLEHARHAIARREHGYCVDDVSRGLLVAARETQPTAQVVRLAERYLAFLTHAQGADGGFRNRLGYDRRWLDEPSTGDWWGRALWGLGTAAARSTVPWIRRAAREAFELGARQRSAWSRAMAFAGLGAAEVLRAHPRDAAAAHLLADAATVVGTPGSDPAWVWPEPDLTYANPALAEVLIAAGDLLGDEPLLGDGLRMLDWLCDMQDHHGRLSTVPVGGWRPGVPRHRYDQQPIEAAATADACATAAAVTGDERWDDALMQAINWFLGDNDAGTVMYDPLTGGGYDGLKPDGPNVNQGAESTLALLATLQHARRLASRGATRPSGGLA